MRHYSWLWLFVMIVAFVSSIFLPDIVLLRGGAFWVLGIVSCLFLRTRTWEHAASTFMQEQDVFGETGGGVIFASVAQDWARKLITAQSYGKARDVVIREPFVRDVFLLTLAFRFKTCQDAFNLAQSILKNKTIDNKTLRYLFWAEGHISPLLSEDEWNKKVDDYFESFAQLLLRVEDSRT